jgi:glutamate racemase
MGRKYYASAVSPKPETDKKPVKAIAIACNTATAVGKADIDRFMEKAELDLQVIGIVDAGARAALDYFRKDEDGTIAVLATAGTVSTQGYVKAIRVEMEQYEYTGQISVIQQAGVGLAGAIDGAGEFIDLKAMKPRQEYQGPSENHPELKIDLAILPRYGFDWSESRMLFDGERTSPRNLQINSVENYIAYHLTTMLERLRKEPGRQKLKSLLLACTHYPFYTEVFEKKLNWYRTYEENDSLIYRELLPDAIYLIDPAEYLARELYQFLHQKSLLNRSDLIKSQFYISTPNPDNPAVEIDSAGNFIYSYKYGRKAGDIQEYVKRVPLSLEKLSPETRRRLAEKVPLSFGLIEGKGN